MKYIRQFFRSTSGQSLTEFALLLPFIFLILIGIFDFGIIVFSKHTLLYASREGARIGSLTNSNEQIETAVFSVMQTLDNDQTHTQLEIFPEDSISLQRSRGSTLTVRVSYEMPLFILDLGKDSITLQSESTTRIETD